MSGIDLNCGSRNTQRFCQHGDELSIRGTVNWWSGKPHSQRAIVLAGDLTSRSARNDVNLKR
jgi:hypothetical protein